MKLTKYLAVHVRTGDLPFWRYGAARQKRPCRGGFTIVEMMFVIALVGTLMAVAVPMWKDKIDHANVARAMQEIRVLEAEITAYRVENGVLPESVADTARGNFPDPWKNPYEYLRIDSTSDSDNSGDSNNDSKKGGKKGGDDSSDEVKPRKDRFLVPVNADYDLYSKGKDGDSKAPFTAKASRDDVVRCNDGVYVGLVSEF